MKRRLRSTVVALVLAAAAVATGAGEPVLEWLGEATIPRLADGVVGPIGGLSALVYDEARGEIVALSDDPGTHAPPRFYRMELDVGDGRLDEGDVVVIEAVLLTDRDGRAIERGTLDPEGLAAMSDGWWLASEGQIRDGVRPALLEFDQGGRLRGELRLPRWLRPGRRPGRRGPRHNLALESVTLSPGGRWLYTATESALEQDGDVASATAGSRVRVVRYDAARGRPDAAFVYEIEPLAVAPVGDGFAVNGLVELLALGGDRLLSLERSYTAGVGNTVRLFVVDLAAAENVRRRRRLGRRATRSAAKSLLVDLADLGVSPDNLEGLTWGPTLEDGRSTLLLVADDNFNPAAQRSQLLWLALPSELASKRVD